MSVLDWYTCGVGLWTTATLLRVDLTEKLTLVGAGIALLSAGVAAISAILARRQAGSAEKSAIAAQRMADTDTQRRHDELQPIWDAPLFVGAGGESSWKVKLMLRQGQLDHLILEIHDSPGIVFDVSRQADVTADRLERHEAMTPGSVVSFWVRADPGHGRRMLLRATAALAAVPWPPVLLPEREIHV